MSMEKLGSSNYNDIFELIDFIDINKLKLNMFSQKEYVNVSHTDSNESWAMTSVETPNKSYRQFVEIELDIPASNLKGDLFNIEESIIFELLNLNSSKNYLDNRIQSVQKQGNMFQVRNYSIISILGKLTLKLVSTLDISEPQYNRNYNFDTEFGHVAFITNIEVPLMLFQDIAYTDGNRVANVNDVVINKHPISSQEFTFYMAAAIKTFLRIFNAKNLGIKKDLDYLFKNISCTLLGGRYNGEIMSLILDDIQEFTKMDYAADEFNIIQLPSVSNLSSINNWNPLDLLSYNSIGFYHDGKFDVVHGFEVFDSKFSKEELSSKSKLSKDVGIRLTFSKLVIQDKTSITNREMLKEMHQKMYSDGLEYLKSKWDRIIIKYRRIFNPSIIDENLLAILFIKKYFIFKSNNPYNLLELSRATLNSIGDFFTQNYFEFEKFFGEDHLTKFLSQMTRVASNIYSWENQRIENDNIRLNQIGTTSSYKYGGGGVLYPDSRYANLDYEYHNREAFSKFPRKRLILINDSGNKQAWKKKTRLFIKTQPIWVKFMIVDPNDKMELLVLKKISKEASHVIFYSEYSKGIDTPEKKAPSQLITYYDDTSFSKEVQRISSNRAKISTFDFNECVFMEFIASSRIFRFNGRDYNDNEFDRELWSKFLLDYQNKTLILVNTSTLKKIVKEEPTLLTIEALAATQEFKDNFKDIHDDYIFVPNDLESRNSINAAAHFLDTHVFSALNESIFDLDTDIIRFWFLILNSYNPELKLLFGKLTSIVFRNISTPQLNRYTRFERIMLDNIIDNFNWGQGTLNLLLFNYLPEDPNSELIQKSLIGFKAISRIDNLYGWKSKVFNFQEFQEDLEQLLKDSNYLNLNIEESTASMQLFLDSYLDRWAIKVDLMNQISREAISE